MASAHSPAINAIKYSDISVKNDSAWGNPDEIWVKDGSWKEPTEVWGKKDGVWVRITNQVRFMKFDGDSSYLNCGTHSFNNYIDGSTTCFYEFTIILTSLASIQTLLSYGSSTSYCTIEVGTDGKVYVKTRYNSGTAWSVNHATALSTHTWYKVRVEFINGASVAIRVRSYNGATVGSDYSSGNVSFNLNILTKYIGKRYDSANYFSGYLLNVDMFGGTYSGTDYRHNANSFGSSTLGSATVTDAYTTDGSQNLTGTDVTVQATG